MADCGASGTALDRAARAILGGSGGSTQNGVGGKQLEHFLGHATMAGLSRQQQANSAMLTAAAPTHVTIPGTATAAPVGIAAVPNVTQDYNVPNPIMAAVWESGATIDQGLVLVPKMPLAMHAYDPYAHSAHPAEAMQAHMMYKQQQHQQHQYHMHSMLQQQQFLQVMQHQYQQRMISDSQKAEAKDGKVENSGARYDPKIKDHRGVESWHEGLEDELSDDLREQIAREYDELLSGGASMEQLAEAWAQAEAEYSAELFDDGYDPSNLWSGEDGTNVNTVSPYTFVNQELSTEPLDWMDEGMECFREGNIRRAIYSFEMELQQNNPDNSLAWRMLGRCHAENDQDDLAIKCLEAAVDRDPYSPETLLALGVSYVNELQHEKALENLKAWITHNPKYAGIDLPEDIYSSAPVNATPDSAFDEVKKLLLAALDYDPSDAGDVYEALGVIYNVNKDYDSAVESFQKAVDLRHGRDYQLYNKLGATLANSGRSEDALLVYHRALQLKPKYARAFLNMAIAHSNLQNHDDAARCYLQALSLNPLAKHCWTYLRMALSCSERWDLLSFVFSQDLAAFQKHFDFVMYD